MFIAIHGTAARAQCLAILEAHDYQVEWLEANGLVAHPRRPTTEPTSARNLELTRLRGHLDTWDQESHKEAHYAPEVHPGVPARVPC